MNTQRTIAEISQKLQELYRQQEAAHTASNWREIQPLIEAARAELTQLLNAQQGSN